jgi:hypothetical protein
MLVGIALAFVIKHVRLSIGLIISVVCMLGFSIYFEHLGEVSACGKGRRYLIYFAHGMGHSALQSLHEGKPDEARFTIERYLEALRKTEHQGDLKSEQIEFSKQLKDLENKTSNQMSERVGAKS